MARPYPEAFPPELHMAAIATTRFGYGATTGMLERIASDPQGWLLSQIETPPDSPALLGLPSGASRISEFLKARAKGTDALASLRRTLIADVRKEELAHTAHALSTYAPFHERLVRFWVNHFSLSGQTVLGYASAHSFEREVIRPYMGGSFVKLLTEAVRHPALLLYFENTRSIGPYSYAGLKGAAGMSDVMARHLLSTLTRGHGISLNESDVAALTRMLTGWSVASPEENQAGHFKYRETWHEPNAKLFINRRYPETGMLEAAAAIDTLARQEETAQYIALRMARYFISDTPSTALISDMLDGFTDGGNSLTGMARGMILSSESWRPVQQKTKSAEDYIFSALRFSGMGAGGASLALRGLHSLGQAPKKTPLLGGWPVSEAAWLSPAQLQDRLRWGTALTRLIVPPKDRTDIAEVALSALGPVLSARTYRRLSVTERTDEALALLFASPEFQRQ